MSEVEKIEAVIQQTGRVPYRNKKITQEAYIEQCIAVIVDLDTRISSLHNEYLQVVNKESVLPKLYVDNLIKRNHILINDLRKAGLYIGQEL
jgi:hypothetical protein